MDNAVWSRLDPSEIVRKWLEAFSRGDADAMVALYADDAVHTSPKVRALEPATGGRVVGKLALRQWWLDAFGKPPPIEYELQTMISSDDVVCIEYVRRRAAEAPLHVAEIFEIHDGKITRSHVYHG